MCCPVMAQDADPSPSVAPPVAGPLEEVPAEASEQSPQVASEDGPRETLLEQDAVLEADTFFDLYEIEVSEGDHVIVNVRSTEMDAFLSIAAPSGQSVSNDDWNMTNTHSHVHLVAQESGTWRVRVAGFDIHQSGPYRIDIFVGPQSPDGSMPPIVKAGSLADGDEEIDGAPGRYMDRHTFEGSAGEHLTIDLRSSVFDTMLILEQDSGQGRWENDDYLDSTDLSHLSVTLPEDGTYTVIVTSFSDKEFGRYDLLVQRGNAPPKPVDMQSDQYEGDLAAGDEQRADGEFLDAYPFDGVAGESVTIDLRSNAFDTYVLLLQEGEDTPAWENDDWEAGNTSHSQITLELPDDGRYTVQVSSYDPGEVGAYKLNIARTPPRSADLTLGELTEDDATHTNGEFIDWYDVPAEPGQVIEAEVTSEDFDTYIIIQSPLGETVENDDHMGVANHSFATSEVERPGIHRIGVTSFEAGLVGEYKLDLRLFAGDDPALQRRITPLAVGDEVAGQLAYGDISMDDGSLTDRYSFEATAGQRVTVNLHSNHFDTYLRLQLPDGSELTNDDFDGRMQSQLAFDVEQSGTYRLFASSYGADELGDYRLEFDVVDLADAQLPQIPGRRVFGLFIGISDYDGFGDLPFCAGDAEQLHRSMREQFGMRAEDSVVLTDQKATIDAVRQALADLGSRASADDVFMIFYSGHGGQIDREEFNAQDPDAKDETLVLVDEELSDDEFAQLLEQSQAGTTMVLLDSCFSGGFAKDVVSAPGRMGLFSSEEDVLSMVASQFQAGGYLSLFVSEAMGSQRDDADLNNDQMLTVLELCHYVSTRYDEVLHEAKPDEDYVEEPAVSPVVNIGFQKLVTDRAGVSPNQVLLSW